MIGADTLPPGDDDEVTDVMWRPEIAAQLAEMRRSSSNMRAAVAAMPDRPTYPVLPTIGESEEKTTFR